MNNDLNIDVRVYPIANPEHSTVAFASVTFCAGEEPISAINSIRIVDSDKGAFMAMPQVQDKNGEYKDVAFPVMKGLRVNMSNAILAEFDSLVKSGLSASTNEPHLHFGGKLPENGAGEISVKTNINPIHSASGNTKAFGSVSFKIDGIPFCVIDNVRVVNSEDKGLFIVMPQSKDRGGEYHDIAFPVKKGLRGQVIDDVLKSYDKAISERADDKSDPFTSRLAAGAQKSEEYKRNSAQKSEPAMSAAKRGAGLGD